MSRTITILNINHWICQASSRRTPRDALEIPTSAPGTYRIKNSLAGGTNFGRPKVLNEISLKPLSKII